MQDETTMEGPKAATLTLTNTQAREVLTAATKGIHAAFRGVGRSVDDDTVMELANETIVRLLTSNFDASQGKIEGFAYIIGKNEAIDYLRGRVHAGARHKNESSMMVTEDDEGNVTHVDIAADQPDAFDRLAVMQRDAWLREEIDSLTPSQRNALLTVMDTDDCIDGKTRINKMRAIDTIVANLPKSMRGMSKRSAHKGKKRK